MSDLLQQIRGMAVIAALALVGCGAPEQAPGIGDYTCSTDEMERVERETLFCNESSGYFASSCYSGAIKRVCTIRPGWWLTADPAHPTTHPED